MSGYDTESIATIVVLGVLILIYLYLLLSPNQPKLPKRPPNIVIQRDTVENYNTFVKGLSSYDKYDWGLNDVKYDDPYAPGGSNETDRYNRKKDDDFFLDTSNMGKRSGKDFAFDDKEYQDDKAQSEEDEAPIVPSSQYVCEPNAWLAIRAELNYKYLWMHGTEEMWMGASATMDTPVHRKAFIMHPVQNNNCNESAGWVFLQEGDSDHFIQMVSPNASQSIHHDAWVIRLGTTDKNIAMQLKSYHFLLEKEGYILNKELTAFINVLPENDYPVRGHSSGWNRDKPARREFGGLMTFQFINESLIDHSIAKEKRENAEIAKEDAELIQQISGYTNPSNENRIISFGLYGSKPKYNQGAIKNAELTKIYFPGWKCRFYVTSDVANSTIDRLKELGSEIEYIPSGMGYTSGMFWRFLVADDPKVDRYIIRDVDSRLNARDR
jgi:hypothetical protein